MLNLEWYWKIIIIVNRQKKIFPSHQDNNNLTKCGVFPSSILTSNHMHLFTFFYFISVLRANLVDLFTSYSRKYKY